ncbi:MAG: hypothetical protein ACYC3N_10640 [Halothiobacillus sp.]
MNLTTDLVRTLFKHLEPLIDARWSREQPLLDAGFLAGSLRRRFQDEEVIRNTSQEELQMLKACKIGQIKTNMTRFSFNYFSDEYIRLGNELEQREAHRKLIEMNYESGEMIARKNRGEQFDSEFIRQYAKEVVQFSTTLSHPADEDVYSKVLQNFSCTHVPYVYEDTLPKRLEIIRAILDPTLEARGFTLDKKLSSTKFLIYSKPFYGEFRLFVATNRAELNPKTTRRYWPLGFRFGIHKLKNVWPSLWENNQERWTFGSYYFYPYEGYVVFKSLPELEHLVRFDLFAYDLIADEFESALRAGFAEAEAAGFLSSN